MEPSSTDAVVAGRVGLRRQTDGSIGLRRWHAADGVALLLSFVAPLAYLLVLALALGLVVAVLPEPTVPTR